MMTPSTLLIDDDGTVADSRSTTYRASLHALHTGDGFIDYAVRNLGFIAVDAQRASVKLRMRPTHVSPIAFAGLMYFLADKRPDRVLLSKLDRDGWQHEFLGSGDVAQPKLARLVARAQCARDGDFLAEPADIDQLPADHPLHQLLDARAALLDAAERHGLDAVAAIAAPLTKGRFALSTADAAINRIVLAAIGNGYNPESQYWLSRIVGHRMNDLPDARYGAWTYDAYAAALKAGTPALDRCDIIVDWPRDGRTRYRNQRLMLPLQLANGSHTLVTATVLDPTVNLRGAAE